MKKKKKTLWPPYLYVWERERELLLVCVCERLEKKKPYPWSFVNNHSYLSSSRLDYPWLSLVRSMPILSKTQLLQPWHPSRLGPTWGQVSYLPIMPTQGGSRLSLLIFHISSAKLSQTYPFNRSHQSRCTSHFQGLTGEVLYLFPLGSRYPKSSPRVLLLVRSPKRSVSYLCTYSYNPLRFFPPPLNDKFL